MGRGGNLSYLGVRTRVTRAQILHTFTIEFTFYILLMNRGCVLENCVH